MKPVVSVVVAAIDAIGTARESIRGFLDETDGVGEVLVVDASRDGTADDIEANVPGARVLRRDPGRLAPELWGDGLAATSAPLVAFSTAAMLPTPGWLGALRERLDETGAAAVGGPIVPCEKLGPTDRAVYLLRYLNYWRPGLAARPLDPPGDNALYRRDRLSGMSDLIRSGFWESEVHERLRSRGERLATADGAAVTFRGGSKLVPMIRQRYRHGSRYGSSRAEGMGRASRVTRSFAAPAVPPVLIRRISGGLRLNGQSPGPWLTAVPGLALLATAWAAGEARGTWPGPRDATETVGIRPPARAKEEPRRNVA